MGELGPPSSPDHLEADQPPQPPEEHFLPPQTFTVIDRRGSQESQRKPGEIDLGIVRQTMQAMRAPHRISRTRS